MSGRCAAQRHPAQRLPALHSRLHTLCHSPPCLLTRQTTGKALGPIAKDSGIRPLEFFMCSVLKEYGYQDALKWLTNYVEDKPVGQ